MAKKLHQKNDHTITINFYLIGMFNYCFGAVRQ